MASREQRIHAQGRINVGATAAAGWTRPRAMGFAIRPLRPEDIPQSVEVERDAFPSHFPPTSFRRELNSRRASYLVAWRRTDVTRGVVPISGVAAGGQPRPRTMVGALLRSARAIWTGHHDADYVVGFLGTWYTVDEVHIVSVGVRSEHRGQGVGELLLIGAIEQAMARRAKTVTLEVRASNTVAKNLYDKYGFRERGVRRGYYLDDREDAIMMASGPIDVPPFPEDFQRLERAHRQRWGDAERVLA